MYLLPQLWNIYLAKGASQSSVKLLMICTWSTWGMLQSWVDITMTKNTAHDGHIQLYMLWSIRRFWAGMLGMVVSETVEKMHHKPPRETYQRICAEQVNNGNHTDGVNSNDMSRVLKSVTTQIMLHNPAHQTHQRSQENMAQDDLLHGSNNYRWFLDGVLNTVWSVALEHSRCEPLCESCFENTTTNNIAHSGYVQCSCE